MPLIASRAGGSARGFGWAVADLGGGSWITELAPSNTSSYWNGLISDNSFNTYLPYTNAAGPNGALVKLNPDGTVAWKTNNTTAMNGGALSGAGIDSSGNVYWGSYYNDANTTIYVYKTNPSTGVVSSQLAFNTGNTANFIGRCISMKPDGTGFVLGNTDGFTTFGPMLTHFNTSFVQQGSQSVFGISQQSYGAAITNSGIGISAAGSSLAGTDFSSKLYCFDGTNGNYVGPICVNNNNQLFGIDYGPTGNGLAMGRLNPSTGAYDTWSNRLTSLSGINGSGICANDTYVYGLWRVTPSSISSVYINKRRISDGALIWQRQISISGINATNLNDQSVTGGQTMSVDANDKFLTFGMYAGTASSKAYVWKVPADGSKTGTYTIGGYNWVYASTSLSNSSSSISQTSRSSTYATRSLTQGTPSFSFSTPTITATKVSIP